MGVNDRARDKKDDSKAAAAARKRGTMSKAAVGLPADWQGVNAELLLQVIASVSRDGGAIRLGYTRDGGAYAIGIYGDGAPFTEYVSPSDDMDEYLRGLHNDYTR